MLGWGDNLHVVKGVATPLYARAITLRDENGKCILWLCLDLAFITEAMRRTIIARLGCREDEITISATHTHSAPGGISDYVIYSLSCDGFQPEIFETYVAGSVEAVREALKNEVAGRIRFVTGHFPTDEPVAFNRSIRAYNRNPEVKKRSRTERHLAVDREMTLLRFEDTMGKPLALWNWFPVHPTSMHRDRHDIHSDNKGLAATLLEDEFRADGTPNFVAVFAQGAAGDVSPNFKYYRFLKEKRGADRNDTESCLINAKLQAAQARKLFQVAKTEPSLDPVLGGILEYRDLANVAVSPEYVGGQTGLKTGPAEFGAPQLAGTAEGRGAPPAVMLFVRIVIKICQLYNYFLDRFQGRETHWPWSDHPVQGNKVRVISAGLSELFETGRVKDLVFPDWVHPTIGMIKNWGRRGQLKQRPFAPQILPLQLVRIGDLLFAAVPAEFTTIAGARLRKMLESEFISAGIRRVVIQGYANAFSSYVVTPEEYVQQGYEGGCTLFGRWTLPAYLTLFKDLSGKFLREEAPGTLRPVPPTAEYMSVITRRM